MRLCVGVHPDLVGASNPPDLFRLPQSPTCIRNDKCGISAAQNSGCRMALENPIARYQKRDNEKIEVTNEESGESEWMWLLVGNSDDERHLVFGQLDSEPVTATDMKRGQRLTVSYKQTLDHRTASDFAS